MIKSITVHEETQIALKESCSAAGELGGHLLLPLQKLFLLKTRI